MLSISLGCPLPSLSESSPLLGLSLSLSIGVSSFLASPARPHFLLLKSGRRGKREQPRMIPFLVRASGWWMGYHLPRSGIYQEVRIW